MRIRLLFSILALAVLLPAVNALSCSVENSCTGGKKCLFTLYSTGGGHVSDCAAAGPYAYSNKVCCDALLSDCAVKTSPCSASEDSILKVSRASNAHFDPSGYSVCCPAPASGHFSCRIDNSCSGSEIGIASVYSTTKNSHVGKYDAYSNKVCCSIVSDPPPYRSNGQPSGTISTSSTTLSLSTDEAANCRYSTTAAVSYGSMASSTTTASGTSHSWSLSGLSDGAKTYYVRCRDTAGNANLDDYPISFTVSTAAPPVDTTGPTITNIGSSPEPVEQGSLVTFSAEITDPSGILRNPPSGNDPAVCTDSTCSTKYCEMGNGGTGDTYSCQHNTIGNAPGSYSYVVSAKDTLGNTETSPAKTFTVASSSCSYPAQSSCEAVSSCHWCGKSSSCFQQSTSFVCQSDSGCGSVSDYCSGGNWYDYNGDGAWNSASKVCFSCTSCNNPSPAVKGKDSVWCSNCDSSAPSTTISPPSSSSWYSSPQTVSFSSSDDCSKTVYYKIDGGATQAYSTPFSALEGSHTYDYWAVDAKGNAEAQKTATIRVDTVAPQISAVSAAPDPFSPNLDGIKDNVSIYFSASEDSGVTIKLYGPSGFVRKLVEDKAITAGAHSEVWNGTNDAGSIVSDGNYLYNITLTDPAGNRNSSIGYLYLDLTPPDIAYYGGVPSVIERGDVIYISAAILDSSGVDSAAVCPSPAMCYDKPDRYCNMGRQGVGSYNCAYDTSNDAVGNYKFYVVANDTQNLTGSVLMQSRIRTTSLVIDRVSPDPVDRQGVVAIAANYSENSSYPVAGASCSVSGDVSGSVVYANGQYVAGNIHPVRLEANSFAVACSMSGFPARSASGSFAARDLSMDLDYDYDPLAVNKTNFLYARVKTVSKYNRVQSANRAVFNVTRETGGSLVASGVFVWNPTTDKWESNFTPQWEDNYTARAYFNATVDGGTFDGSASVRMGAGKGIKVSAELSDSVEIDLGSSALVTIFVENRRSRDISYNVTLIGGLSPASFDGQALLSSGRKYSTFGLVPANSVQPHPLLIKGMEVSPAVKEIIVRFKETQPPYGSDEVKVYYKVFSSAGGSKLAPDLDLPSLLALALLSAALLPAKGFRPRRRGSVPAG